MATPDTEAPDASAADDSVPNTTNPPASPHSPKHIPRSKHNAFTALMAHPKRKRTPPPTTPPSDPARTTTALGRNGLSAYITSPSSFPATRVIYHTPSFVIINDLFPKSSIHLLILPRSPAKQVLHPFEAFDDDPAFLAEVQAEVAKVKDLAAKELRRRFGKFSATERARRAWEDEEDARLLAHGEGGGAEVQLSGASTDPAPAGRDYAADIVAGIHAVPSMTHLHIHVLSRDRHSPCLKHRKHYNSFATDFLVPMEAFPLGAEDRRRWPGREGYLAKELVCWRCGRGFGSGFKGLKEHLEVEFEGWKAE